MTDMPNMPNMPGTPGMASMAQGSVVGGRYHLVAEIGRGGMGVVWQGHDDVLDRPVAVKLLTPQSPDQGEHLLNEARAAARLSHPHIASVHDFGARPPYIVMELLDGEPLGDLLHEGRFSQVSPAPDREIAAQVASALAAAHESGILHRDITASNVVVTSTGAKVVDFGIASLARSAGPATHGTPRYLAPELHAGAPATPAVDVYAFGVLLEDMSGGDADLAALSARCRSAEPGTRPSMRDVTDTLEPPRKATSHEYTSEPPSGRSDRTRPLTEATVPRGHSFDAKQARPGVLLAAGLVVITIVLVIVIIANGAAAPDQNTAGSQNSDAQVSDFGEGPPAGPTDLGIALRNAASMHSDNQLSPHLGITNNGKRPVDLSKVTIRYWFSGTGADSTLR